MFYSVEKTLSSISSKSLTLFILFSPDFVFCRTILSATLTFGFLIFFSSPPHQGQSRFDRKGANTQCANVQIQCKFIANTMQFLKWNMTKTYQLQTLRYQHKVVSAFRIFFVWIWKLNVTVRSQSETLAVEQVWLAFSFTQHPCLLRIYENKTQPQPIQ